jgi:hypothetical protein
MAQAPVLYPRKLDIMVSNDRVRFKRRRYGCVDFLPLNPQGEIEFVVNDPRIVVVERGFVALNFELPGSGRLEQLLAESRATIKLKSVWPKSSLSGMRPLAPPAEDGEAARYEAQLKEYCERKHAIFVKYEWEKGRLWFFVPSFVESGMVFDFP